MSDDNWVYSISFRHLITSSNDPFIIMESMQDLVEFLEQHDFMGEFLVVWGESFRGCDDLEYANDLMEELWNFCDDHDIFVEPNREKV